MCVQAEEFFEKNNIDYTLLITDENIIRRLQIQS
jgi:hypothetical protein